MALSDLDVTLQVQIDSEIETGTVVDGSTFTTPARADVRVFVNVYKVDHNSVATQLATASDTEDPQTAASWTWDYDKDGYHKILYVAIPEYDAGVTYAQYDAVADDSTDAVYRSKVGSNLGNALSNTAFWEVISDPATLASNFEEDNESQNIASLISLRVLRPLSQQAYSKLIGNNCGCTDCEDKIIPEYNLFGFWLDGAEVADQRAEVLDGELICRRIESRFLDC